MQPSKEVTTFISREAAIDAFNNIGSLDTEADRKYARSVFDEIPSADVRENVRGKWEFETGDEWDGGGAYRCSVCQYGYSIGAYFEADNFNYCPNCGADMRERREDAETH